MPSGGESSAVDRLRVMLGLSVEEFLATFPHRYNVIDAKNEDVADALRHEVRGVVFVLGSQAWRGLGFPRARWFTKWEPNGLVKFVLLPHPSGRNHIYNDLKMRQRVRREVERCLS